MKGLSTLGKWHGLPARGVRAFIGNGKRGSLRKGAIVHYAGFA